MKKMRKLFFFMAVLLLILMSVSASSSAEAAAVTHHEYTVSLPSGTYYFYAKTEDESLIPRHKGVVSHMAPWCVTPKIARENGFSRKNAYIVFSVEGKKPVSLPYWVKDGDNVEIEIYNITGQLILREKPY